MKRYEPDIGTWGAYCGMEEWDDGEWMRYDDHLAAVEKARGEYRDEIVARLIRERENYDVHTREWSALERAVEIASKTPPTEG